MPEETKKQPTILDKIMLIDEKIEKLGNILSPVMNIGEDMCSNIPEVDKSITLERLDICIKKLDVLIKRIDIN